MVPPPRIPRARWSELPSDDGDDLWPVEGQVVPPPPIPLRWADLCDASDEDEEDPQELHARRIKPG